MKKICIIDWYGTLYNPVNGGLYDDVASTLNTLRVSGYVLALLSQGNKEHRLQEVRDMGLIDTFDEIVIASPAKEYHHMVELVAGYDTAQSYCIGDNLYQEIAYGRKAGLHTILVQSGRFGFPKASSEDIAEYTVDAFSDIAGIMPLAE